MKKKIRFYKALFPNIRITQDHGGFYEEPVEDIYEMRSSEMAFTAKWGIAPYGKE